jgi:hypothetical protein
LIERESESGFVRLVKRGFDLVFRQRRRETEKRERERGKRLGRSKGEDCVREEGERKRARAREGGKKIPQFFDVFIFLGCRCSLSLPRCLHRLSLSLPSPRPALLLLLLLLEPMAKTTAPPSEPPPS